MVQCVIFNSAAYLGKKYDFCCCHATNIANVFVHYVISAEGKVSLGEKYRVCKLFQCNLLYKQHMPLNFINCVFNEQTRQQQLFYSKSLSNGNGLEYCYVI